jgi:hypothetical protein
MAAMKQRPPSFFAGLLAVRSQALLYGMLARSWRQPERVVEASASGQRSRR